MSVDLKAARAWGLENGYRCSTGRLSGKVIDAYVAAHPSSTEPPAPDTAEEEGAAFSVTVVIDGHEEAATAIAAHLVEALWEAFHAGRAAERRDILARLGDAS